MSSVLFGCFNKQRSSVNHLKSITSLKEKVVPLTLTPTSIWKQQNLSEFLLLLALTDKTIKHELNEAFFGISRIYGEKLG